MNFIDNVKNRAKKNLKTIILPESMDIRVIKAAKIVHNEKIAIVKLIGNINNIKALDSSFDSSEIEVIDPSNCSYLEEMINEFVLIRKNKGLTYDDAKKLLLNDYMYFACMLVKMGKADGVVSGACHSSANTIRPALQIIKTKETSNLVSAFFLMCVPDCNYGYNGTFIFADSGLVQNPNPEELANIAKDSADSFKILTGEDAIVAMISHSTKGSATHPDVTKVVEACKIARSKFPEYNIDGELQVDAAIVPEVAKMKASNSCVAGNANVLIFPNLDAGNSGYKLVQRLAKAQAFGPICQGIAAPVNDLSRGCNVEDIVGVIAITAVQAQYKYN